MNIKVPRHFFALLISISCWVTASCQPAAIDQIEEALEEHRIQDAERILHNTTGRLASERKADSLVNYIFITGKVWKAKGGAQQFAKKIEALYRQIATLTQDPLILQNAAVQKSDFYGSIGMDAAGYQATLEALKFASRAPSGNRLAMLENNLSTFAQRLGDINLSMQHSKRALQHLATERAPDYETYYVAYNNMGSMLYFSSKIDSAAYYYEKALEVLKNAERTPRNQYLRPAIVNNNLSGIYQLQGKVTRAIASMESVVDYFGKFMASDEPDNKKVAARTRQFEATDNLAGIYKDLGDYRRARSLLEYSYQQKQKYLDPEDPGIFKSQILLGQLYFSTGEDQKASAFLNAGLEKISGTQGDYLLWKADACNTLGRLAEKQRDIKNATHYYEKADSLYEQSMQGDYDNIYLEFLGDAALFLAENGHPERGRAKALKGYNYTVGAEGFRSLLAFQQLIGLAKVYYVTGDYRQSLAYSRQSLDVVNQIISGSDNLLDSIKMEMKKPQAILQKARASYQLLDNKNEANLQPVLDELLQALTIIERQKIILNDPKDINLLMEENRQLTEFIEKLTHELYVTTGRPRYLNELISLRESSLYNRIRSRLDKNDSLQFFRVPTVVMNEERGLKSAVARALEGSGTHEQKMDRYFEAIKNWAGFQEKLRQEHPRYYKMRYASIFKEAEKIDQYIPATATLVRYFFIDKKLYAFVADRQEKVLVSLDNERLAEKIGSLSDFATGLPKISQYLHDLYEQLWRPITAHVRHQKIIIIPDGILFNLNFEILTPTRIKSFRELATNSLLAAHTISYNYSLLLVNQSRQESKPLDNFVAFAPGFSDEIKSEYRQAFNDSFRIDKEYLYLLPQPFSVKLAGKIKAMFQGSAYLNEHSTQSSFRNIAGNHKIIHIGTHAEANDEHPAFSRLIFSKDLNDLTKENSLFADDIYGCDLTSDLAVLTACESGRPGYQDGEGMISLTHAFNFAGSESVITGLWKIDERSSTILLEEFYKQLSKGLPKDEALRLAKLHYLKTAEGRMLAPQYWAGLVLMGDTSPVHILPRIRYIAWLLTGGLLALAVVGWLFLRRNKKQRRAHELG